MKKALLLVFAALMLPTSVALAANPGRGHSAPKVLYVLRGTLSAYHAYDAGTSTNGSITIHVTRASNAFRTLRVLKGQDLTFAVTANTRITFADGVTAIADGDRGSVKVRAPRRIAPANLAATLQTHPARMIHDRGAPPTP